MEIWVLILSALCYIVAVSAQNDAVGSDPFAGNQYMITYNELKMCSIPSSKMFTREVDASGTPIASTFDAFCYHRAQKESTAHFMCLYYKQIIETYFKDYCKLEDGNPSKKPLDESTQYQNFASSPENVSTYLASTIRAQDDKVVFKTAEECLQFCHQTKQSMEFCTNFGFALSIASNMSKTGEENQPQGTDTSGDAVNQAENTDEGTSRTEGENQPQGADTSGVLDTPPENTGGDAANPDEENEELDEAQDNIDNEPQPFIGGEVLTNITNEDFGQTDFEGNDGLDNELQGNVDEFGDSYSSDGTYEQTGDQEDGGIFGDFNLEKPGDNFEKEKEEEEEEENIKVNQAVIPSSNDQRGDMNLLIEKERELLEEESSSHFLAYSLTAIILVMVTYILYHNKKKIVAVIVEGRHNGQGKRRRYNQNVYTTLDETA